MLFQARNQRSMIPTWFWVLLIFLPLGILTWWFLRWFFLPSYQRISSVEIDTPRSSGVPLPLQKDDFTILKGVGPKTAAGLYQAGIMTFEQLGLMNLEALVQALKAQGLPSSNAQFWKEQAVLAAGEDWEGLKDIQE